MEGLILFSIIAVFVGALLAWFHRKTFLNLCIKTALTTLVLIVALILILDGPPKSYSPEYLLSGILYFVYPYLVFVLIPGVVGGGLVWVIRRKLYPEKKSESPESRQEV